MTTIQPTLCAFISACRPEPTVLQILLILLSKFHKINALHSSYYAPLIPQLAKFKTLPDASCRFKFMVLYRHLLDGRFTTKFHLKADMYPNTFTVG